MTQWVCDRCKKEIPRDGARFSLDISRQVDDEDRKVIKLLPEVGVDLCDDCDHAIRNALASAGLTPMRSSASYAMERGAGVAGAPSRRVLP